MGLYNFRPGFAPYVLDGTKRHTIRAERRHEDEPGDTMHLYVGLRTKQVRLLFRAPQVKWEPVVIVPSKGLIVVSEQELRADEKNELAWRDGFRPEEANLSCSPFEYMLSWWRITHPADARFTGRLKHWNYDRRQAA